MRHYRSLGHLMLAVALLTPAAQGGAPWFGPDRIKHFFLSFFVQTASYSLARAANVGHGPALGAATAVTAAVAFSKEVWDRQRGSGFDRRDLVWDAAGAGAASLLLVRTVRD